MVYTHIKRDKEMDQTILDFVHSFMDCHSEEGGTFCLHVNNEETQ